MVLSTLSFCLILRQQQRREGESPSGTDSITLQQRLGHSGAERLLSVRCVGPGGRGAHPALPPRDSRQETGWVTGFRQWQPQPLSCLCAFIASFYPISVLPLLSSAFRLCPAWWSHCPTLNL